MLRDSAHIQEFEAEWRNRKAKRSGEAPYEPIYTMDDAVAACELLVPVDYDCMVKICDEISVRYEDAGHLLGSASIKMFLTEGEEKRTIIFQGMLEILINLLLKILHLWMVLTMFLLNQLMVTDYTETDRIMWERLARILNETFERGGNVVIPSFAVGRTQEMLYFLRIIKKKQWFPDSLIFRFMLTVL